MKAIVCEKFGPPSDLVLREFPSPVPGPKDVLIEVRACSVNFPDTLIIQGKYQYKPELPFTPGNDIAGVVKAVGAQVTHLSVGQEVFGFVMRGGFAEEVVAPAKNIFPKPPKMDFTTAASFMMAYSTSYHALVDRARLQAGETLVVLGAAGGVGLAAVELGKQLGARVIAAASTAEKLDLCKQYGADELLNYSEENLKQRIKELTDGRGAQVVYDPVGGAYSEAALRATAWAGRYLVVGFAAGTIPQIPLNLPLLKGCALVGVFWGSFAQQFPRQNIANTQQLLAWFAEGKLRPHLHATYPLAQTAQAIEAIIKREVRGKVVVVNE
ncbi:MAG: NADPH:quinone oxidoreductase family protein [Bacteroidota bacterium]